MDATVGLDKETMTCDVAVGNLRQENAEEAACCKGGGLDCEKCLQGDVDARGNWNRLCRLLDASV